MTGMMGTRSTLGPEISIPGISCGLIPGMIATGCCLIPGMAETEFI